jgi:hypothetical protein
MALADREARSVTDSNRLAVCEVAQRGLIDGVALAHLRTNEAELGYLGSGT